MTTDRLAQAWNDVTFSSWLSAGIGQARDQLTRPTCVAFAITAANESRRADGLVLSTEYLLWAARQRDGLAASAQHTTILGACDALREVGQPLEAKWPYEGSRLIGPHYAPPPDVGDRYQRGSRDGATLLHTVTTSIDATLAPVLVVAVTRDFYTPQAGRVLAGTAGTPVGSWLHAVAGVGHGVTAAGDKVVAIRNSWGKMWGVNGYGLLPEQYLNLHLRQVVVVE